MIKLFRINLTSFIIIILITLINCIYSYKYFLRITDYSISITFIYGFLLIFLADYILQISINDTAKIRNILYFIIALYILCIIVIFVAIDPTKLKVDRWSVITSFWDAIFNGKFPYLAHSHMGSSPGPFPFYFVIGLPFYFIGEIGYLSLLGVLLMLVVININYQDNEAPKLCATFLLISSISILWELVARSTILVNSLLILLYLYWVINNQSASLIKVILIGFLGGLLLSTRGIFIIPFIICYTYIYLKAFKIKELCRMVASFLCGFLITLIPFIIWDYNLFMEYNPITLQASFVGLYTIILSIIISIIVGFIVKNAQGIYLGSGIIILGTVMIYLIGKIKDYGLNTAIIAQADISYLIFALPFLLVSIYTE